MKKDFDRMTGEQPNSGDHTATSTSNWWRKIIIAMAIVLLGGTASGLLYGWYFIQRKLTPLVETEAGEYLHRPLELGEFQKISLTGASFGTSALPATADNPDFVKVETVKINFAPLYFLRKRILQLDIILIKPDVYLEQDESRTWTPTNFGSGKPSSGKGIKVDVETIQLKGGKLTLAARQPQTKTLNPPVKANMNDLIIGIVNDGEQIKFDAAGELIKGGKFTVDGKSIKKTGIIDLTVGAQQLDTTEVSNLLALPIEFSNGDLSGKIGVKLTDNPLPELRGTVNLDDVSLQIPELANPFSNSDGKIHLNGSQIKLDKIATNFGEVSGVANGSLDLAGEGDYQIDTKVEPAAVNQVVAALELESPPVPIKGKIEGDVKVRGSFENLVTSFNLATVTPSQIDQVDFQKITADLDLVGTTLFVRQFTSLPQAGGQITGTGKLQLDESQNLVFDVRAKDVSGKAIAKGYNNQLPLDLGLISGETTISAQAGNLETLRFIDTTGSLGLGNGTVKVDNLNYAEGKWSSQLKASGVEFGSLPIGKGSAPKIAQGLVDGTFKVSGTSDVGNLSKVRATGTANLNTEGGKIAIPNLQIADGTWKADAATTNLKLQRLFPELPTEFNDNLSGDFYLTGNIPDDTQPQTIINGFGDLTLAEGKVKVEDLKIVEQNWTAKAQGTDLKLKELSSATPDQFAGLINGSLNLAGTTDNITPDGIKAKGNGSLTLPEGVFAANKIAIAKGRFNAQIIPQNVDLSLFADPNSDALELNGQLGGQLNATGRVDNLSPTAVSATGNLTFSEGIDLLEQPLGAAIRWNGKRLDVLQAQGDGLDAQGYIELDESFFSDIPDKLAAVNYFEFDVPEAMWLDVRKLRLTLPSWATNLDYSGRGDFSGKISGIPSSMAINGDLNLRDFRVENIDFAPLLVGDVQVSPETGVNLQLTEDINPTQSPDKIELVLNRDFLPLSFAIAQDDIKVTGTGQKEILQIATENVPLDLLKTVALKSDDLEVPENIAVQPISGKLSGALIFNLNTLATSGKDVEITYPTLARIRGDRLKGDFQYSNGYFALQDVEFKQRQSIYKLEGSLVQKPDDFELDGRVTINDGQIQDVLIALQIFEFNDFNRLFSDRAYGNAKDLYRLPGSPKQPPLFNTGLNDAPVIQQVQLLAAIQAWLASAQKQRQSALIPDIANLRGTFDGKVSVSGSLTTGVDSQFEFLGKQWQWGNLAAEEIIANGNLSEGIVTLLPVSIKLKDTSRQLDNIALSPTLLFTGTFGGETQSGQFRLVEVPVKLIEQLFALPSDFALGGLVNASASIAGTKDNPLSRGEVTIDNASINQTSIQSTKSSFNYKDARLIFSGSSIIAKDAEPLTVKGSIPYQLPFASVMPDSDRLELQVNVKNKGLELLDIFSKQEFKWINGQGEIALDISGILDANLNLPRKLVAQGSATIKNGTIAAKSLPKNPLTNINSQVFFDLDNIRVQSFQGNFGGGKILAAGTMPLSKDSSLDPLIINFYDIKKVDLKGLYDGGAKGQLQILGKATEPNITGDITLFDGTILLADDTAPIPTDNLDSVDLKETDRGLAAATQYKNLKLQLGQDIQISQPPIFTFVATGSLNVNGTFNEPSPDGTIVLQRGQVNLFTTQLNLSRDYKNTARFSSNNILDPFLDVLLVGSALETSGRSIPSDALSTEIPASSFGTLETVRISAKVKGLASQITNKIELTSSPSRSPAEIVALLGGGFVETLGKNTSTLGLATLAGSALFGSLNAEFNNAFPIGELRLFPTQIVDENRDDGRIDGLAGELAIDLVDNLSFSALKILNVSVPAQFGLRYRLSENFVLRGSTNFEDESRGVIEFESRF